MKKVIKVKVESVKDNEQIKYIEIRKDLNGHVSVFIKSNPDIATIYNCTRDAIIDASKYYDAIKDAVFYNTNEYDLIDISIGDVSVADTFEETSIKSLLES